MIRVITILQMLVRGVGAILIVLGLLFWTGNAFALLQLHMMLGLVLVIALWMLAGLAASARVQPGLIVLAVLWGLVVPALGMTQDRLLPGDFHWVIKVLHLLVGFVAIALGERLAASSKRARAALQTSRVVPASSNVR